jgi:signal transduction histidine kinase
MQSLTYTLSTIIHDMSSIPKVIRFHVLTVIHGLAIKFRPLAESKGLTFTRKIPTAALTGLEVAGDPSRLIQLLNILLRNSIRATRQGGVLFEVKKVPSAPGRVDLKFMVGDTGRDTEGLVETTGLGWIHYELGLALSLVEAMDARMSLYSTPTVGITTTVKIPFKLPIPTPSEVYPPPQIPR